MGACSNSSNDVRDPATESNVGADAEPSVQQSANSGDQQPQGPGNQAPGDLDSQRRAALVDKYLADARDMESQGQLEAALEQLRKAKDLEPGNREVIRRLQSVSEQLDVDAGTTSDTLIERVKVAEQRRRAQVQENLQRGRVAMEQKAFKLAEQEFRAAVLTIEAGDPINWEGLDLQARNMLAEAEQAAALQRRRQIEEESKAFEARAREQQEQQRIARIAQVQDLLQRSLDAFEREQFDASRDLAEAALQLDTANPVAFDLVQAANKAARYQSNQRYIYEKGKELRRHLEESERMKIPQSELLELDTELWARAKGRRQSTLPVAQVDELDQAMIEKVATSTVRLLTFEGDNAEYPKVLRTLESSTGVPIIVTPAAQEAIDSEAPLFEIELAGIVTLENFLDQMMRSSESLTWTVKNGVVQVTTIEEAGAGNITHSYSVRDLIFERTDFLPPKIDDLPGEGGVGLDEVKRTGGEAEERIPFVAIDVLEENIRAATNPNYWDEEFGTLRVLETGYLLVNASDDMHRRVTGVLNDMRSFAGNVVSIDSKFLTITRNFLQEVGVDFRGLGGAGNTGSNATLDDITNGLDDNASRGLDNGGTGDPAANPSAGAFFNDGGDGDVRTRTENFFANSLGEALSSNGGITAALTILDDFEIQSILKAVEKQEDVELVNSQILSLLSNQRGHVAVINQTAFVRDFDVEVASASFIADPKVDVVQDGVVLDVRPVVRYDRKAINLTLKPTVAELALPIPTFTSSLAGGTLPVVLQLPELTVTSFATTTTSPGRWHRAHRRAAPGPLHRAPGRSAAAGLPPDRLVPVQERRRLRRDLLPDGDGSGLDQRSAGAAGGPLSQEPVAGNIPAGVRPLWATE